MKNLDVFLVFNVSIKNRIDQKEACVLALNSRPTADFVPVYENRLKIFYFRAFLIQVEHLVVLHDPVLKQLQQNGIGCLTKLNVTHAMPQLIIETLFGKK